jgi:CysZ protein
VLEAIFRALSQLGEPPIRRVILKTLGWTILSFVVLLGLAWWLIGWLSGLHGWWGEAAQWGGALGALLIAWFTFPAVAATIASFYCEEVALAVEAKYYPGRGPALEVPLIGSILDGLKLAGLSLLINLVALPFLLIPPLYPIISWGLGGYLIGREYYEMVALRRLDRGVAHQLLAQHRAKFTLAGILIAVVLTIPVLNLIAPVIAVAFMVHLAESVVNQRAIRST